MNAPSTPSVADVELDSVRRYRNRHEYRCVNRATYRGRTPEEDIVIVGDGDITGQMAVRLSSRPDLEVVRFWRGSTLALGPMPIKQRASVVVCEGDRGLHIEKRRGVSLERA